MAGIALFAVGTSGLVLVGLCCFVFFGIVIGYYTKSGNDIEQRPSDGLGGDSESAAPAAEGESRIAGKVDGEQDTFATHGTQ